MERSSFLTIVAGVMKGMVSYEKMMASIQRSCMRAEAENLELMSVEEEKVDKLIECINSGEELQIPDNLMDVLVLRYLRNTQFLAKIKEDYIDVSGLADDLGYWKKTMLFKAPNQRIECSE
jgi:hypothetical protein